MSSDCSSEELQGHCIYYSPNPAGRHTPTSTGVGQRLLLLKQKSGVRSPSDRSNETCSSSRIRLHKQTLRPVLSTDASFSPIIRSSAAIETHQALKYSSIPAGRSSSPDNLMHLSEGVSYYFHRRTTATCGGKSLISLINETKWGGAVTSSKNTPSAAERSACDETKTGWWEIKPQHLHCAHWKHSNTTRAGQCSWFYWFIQM